MVRGETVKEYADRWVAAREKKGITCAVENDSKLRIHFFETHAELPMAGITRPMLEDFLTKLDQAVVAGTMKWKTARNVSTACFERRAGGAWARRTASERRSGQTLSDGSIEKACQLPPCVARLWQRGGQLPPCVARLWQRGSQLPPCVARLWQPGSQLAPRIARLCREGSQLPPCIAPDAETQPLPSLDGRRRVARW